jgi:uncharacterized protein YccT (UPF0319 family)
MKFLRSGEFWAWTATVIGGGAILGNYLYWFLRASSEPKKKFLFLKWRKR